MRIRLDRKVLVVVLCVGTLLLVPVLALWQQWGLWRYSTNGAPNSVAISSDGSYLAVGVGAGLQSGRILFFDRAGSLLWSHDTDRVISSVAISADGSHIAAGGYQLIGPPGIYENGIVYYLARDGTILWNYTTKPSPNTPSFDVPVYQVHLSSDGNMIAADTGYGMLFLDSHGQPLWSQPAHGDVASHTVMSLDGTYVVTIDDRARAFDNQGRSLWNSSIIPQTVQNIAMSPDGRYLAVDREINPNNGTLYLFNQTGDLLRTQAFNSPPYSITFSADGNTMVVGTEYSVIAFDLRGRTLWNWTTPSGSGVSSLATTTDGSYTLTGLGARADFGQTILVFNNEGIPLWGKPIGTARQIALSSDGSYAAIAAWPMISSTSFPSGSIYLLPGPRALATVTGPVYSLLYFGQNTGLVPSAIILAAAISATLIVVAVARSRHRVGKNPAGPNWKVPKPPVLRLSL